MRKLIVFTAIAFMMAFIGSAYAGDDPSFPGLNPKYASSIVNSPTSPVGNLNIKFVKGHDIDYLQLSNIRGVKKVGKTVTYPLAVSVKILSGAGDDNIKDDLLVKTDVPANGIVNVPLLDFGKEANAPFNEHIYGTVVTADGEELPLLLHAASKWVCYPLTKDGKPNLEKLAIAVTSYVKKQKLPTKIAIEETQALADGYYLSQRSHPELFINEARLNELERLN